MTLTIQTEDFGQYDTTRREVHSLEEAKQVIRVALGFSGFQFAEVVKDGEVVHYVERSGLK